MKDLNLTSTRYSDFWIDFRFKLIKFWVQSFLAGIPLIKVGFRDDDGKLKGKGMV